MWNENVVRQTIRLTLAYLMMHPSMHCRKGHVEEDLISPIYEHIKADYGEWKQFKEAVGKYEDEINKVTMSEHTTVGEWGHVFKDEDAENAIRKDIDGMNVSIVVRRK